MKTMRWPSDSDPSTPSPAGEMALVPLPLAPVLWKDWPRCDIRRAWLKIIRRETVVFTDLSRALTLASSSGHAKHVLTRAERAHWHLSWEQRLARNARPSDTPRLIVTLHGLPATFASSFGFDLLASA